MKSHTYTHITFIKKYFTSGHISCLYIVYHRHHHITTHTSFNLSLLLRFSNTSNFFYRIGSNQHNHLRANNVASIGVLCGLGVCVVVVWARYRSKHAIVCIRVVCCLLKLVFSEIHVRTWAQMVSRQKNRPLIGRPDRLTNQKSVFWQETP